eukprot:5949380-Ditylum_brightwellii.AAC.1
MGMRWEQHTIEQQTPTIHNWSNHKTQTKKKGRNFIAAKYPLHLSYRKTPYCVHCNCHWAGAALAPSQPNVSQDRALAISRAWLVQCVAVGIANNGQLALCRHCTVPMGAQTSSPSLGTTTSISSAPTLRVLEDLHYTLESQSPIDKWLIKVYRDTVQMNNLMNNCIH